MKIPSSFAAGDTLSWSDTVPLYPAGSGYTLHYVLISATKLYIIDSTASGEDHAFAVAATTTSGYTAGDYDWYAYATLATGERYEVGYGRLTIKPNLVTATTGLDTRSNARKILEELESAWLTASTNRAFVFDYMIGSRRMRFATRQEWILELNYWRAEVAKEERIQKINDGVSAGNRLLVRF